MRSMSGLRFIKDMMSESGEGEEGRGDQRKVELVVYLRLEGQNKLLVG